MNKTTDWTTIRGIGEHYGAAAYFNDGAGSFAIRHGPRRNPLYYWYRWDVGQGRYVLTGTTRTSLKAEIMFIAY